MTGENLRGVLGRSASNVRVHGVEVLVGQGSEPVGVGVNGLMGAQLGGAREE